MCGSMADIQSAAAEIRRGKRKKEQTTAWKYNGVPVFHRPTIITGQKYNGVPVFHRATIITHTMMSFPTSSETVSYKQLKQTVDDGMITVYTNDWRKQQKFDSPPAQ